MKILFNDTALFAIPRIRYWAVMFFASLLFGIIGFDFIAPHFIKMLGVVIETTSDASLNNIHPALMGAMILAKNTFVALLCILTARLTVGIYPAIVIIFNGMLIGFVSTLLIVHGGMQLWQITAGLAPHIGFELFGIFLACAIGFLRAPLKLKLQASSLVWVSLLIAAGLESTISSMITSSFM